MAQRSASQVNDWVTVQPDDWETVSVSAAPQMTPSSGPAPAVTPETMPGRAVQSSALARFLGAGAEMADPRQLIQMLIHPGETARSVINAPMEQFQKAINAPTKTEAVGHGLAAAVPIVGPIAAGIGEQMGSGDVAGGLGAASTLLAPSIVPRVAKLPGMARNAAMTRLAGGPAGSIEQAILRGGGSLEAKAITARIAPELAKDAELVKAAASGKFDKIAIQRYQGAQTLMDAAEKTIPKGTTVPKAPIIAELQKAIQERSVFKANPEIVANPRSLEILKEWQATLDKLPDKIPFDELRKFRQELDYDIANHNGWKETGSAADRAEMIAKRQVVNSIRNNLKGISPALDAANKAFSQASDLVGASGIKMDIPTPRRLSTVGKRTPVQKTIRRAVKYGAPTLVGSEIARRLLNDKE